MKPYLVDVPVRVAIWIRTDCQRKQFEVLKKARPSVLFLQSDGGRNETEWEAIRKNRSIFETEIDWDCTVYKLYEEENLGLYTMGAKVARFIWERVDRCIFLEDDILPSASFFQYCADLLEKYKDDYRVSRICGMNHMGRCENVSTDYFFSRHGSVWGTATWRRTYVMRDWNFNYGNDPYVMGLLRENAKNNHFFLKKAEGYVRNKYHENHVAGGEFFHGFAVYGYHQLQIIPKVNLVSNIGCTADAAHSASLKLLAKGTQRMFNMPVYEMSFPMKHMEYMIPDIAYEKRVEKIGGYNSLLTTFYRRLEHYVRVMLYGNTWERIKKRIKKKRIET